MTKINHHRVREVGRFLYADDFGKLYILNVRKDGYLMLDARQQRLFQLFRMRFVIAMLTGFLIHYYVPKPLIAIVLGAGVFLVFQLLYRFVFLPSLREVTGTPISEKRGWLASLTLAPRASLGKLALLSAVISGLFLYNFITLYLWPAFTAPREMEAWLTWVFYIAMILASAAVCALALFHLLKKREEQSS